MVLDRDGIATMLRRILLIGPQSDTGRAGAERAAAFAERSGATVEFLDVVYDPHLAGYLGDQEVYESLRRRVVAEREAGAQAISADLEKRGVSCAVKVLWAYPRHMTVAREAAAEDVDLVVLEPEDPLRGLTQDEWRLVSICPAPVLVARAEPGASYKAVVAAVDPGRAHDKPAGLDARIVEQAKAVGELFGARVDVLHCAPPLAPFIRDPMAESALRDAEILIRDERARALDALIEGAGLPEEAVAVVEGRPDDVLAERSAKEGTLVVIGTVSRGPIARLLIGSTAAQVLREAGGDVLVVKPPGFGLTAEQSAG